MTILPQWLPRVAAKLLLLTGAVWAVKLACHFGRNQAQESFAKCLTCCYYVLLYVDAYIYPMSKLSRQAVIRGLINDQEVGSQDELRRLLFRRGHRVTQATLSRDVHELGLVKTDEGYKLPLGEEAELSLPSIERLIRDVRIRRENGVEPGDHQDQCRQRPTCFGGH